MSENKLLPERKVKIFLAEDNNELRMLLKTLLLNNDFLVEDFSRGQELLDNLSHLNPDLLLLDYKLQDMKTTHVLDEMDKRGIKIPFIIVTGHGDEKIAVEMMKRGAVDYIIKDIQLLDILPGMVQRAAKEVIIREKLIKAEHQLSETLLYYELLAKNIADVIWTINLEQQISYTSPSIEKLIGYSPKELDGRNFYDFISNKAGAKIREILDKLIREFKTNGYASENKKAKRFELLLQHKDGSHIWTESQISSLVNSDHELIGLLGVTRNIQIRKETELKLKQSYDTLYNALISCIDAMGKTTEMRDPYTAGHQKMVSKLALKIAVLMGLSPETCNCVKLAAQVHDIGKIRIPSEILHKPAKCTENEYAIIKVHPQVGYDILHTIEFPWPIAEIVLQHHERMDGSGYPKGLKAHEIIMEAKIISVADVVVAMTAHRPYRPAWNIDATIKEIDENKGLLYDEEVVGNCIRVINEDNFLFTVE